MAVNVLRNRSSKMSCVSSKDERPKPKLSRIKASKSELKRKKDILEVIVFDTKSESYAFSQKY